MSMICALAIVAFLVIIIKMIWKFTEDILVSAVLLAVAAGIIYCIPGITS